MSRGNVIRFIITLVLCQGAGIVGSIFAISGIEEWYVFLEKPFFSPPNWVFGPVWIILYALMAVSLFIVWQKGLENKKVKAAFYFFWVHLVFNTVWSILFFGLKNPLFALLDIIILWIMIVVLIFRFFKINKTAGCLLIPYWLWVSFATILNFFIWKLN